MEGVERFLKLENEMEIPLLPLRRFVDAFRDKPERRTISVLSLRLPRRRAFRWMVYVRKGISLSIIARGG